MLFTPPYYTSYNDRFYETALEVVARMYHAAQNLRDQYEVEYYNGASLPEFSTHPELFYNSDHLNECGNRAFSEFLKKEMDSHK